MFSFLLIAAIAYGVAFWIASTGAPVWRAVVGFSIALVVGWVGGTGIAVFLLSSIASTDAGATTFNLLGKGFWLALFGAGYGVHRGRGKLKAAGALQTTAIQKIVPSTPAGNDAYAAALAEIEEVRLDKGVWARSFAESGGDESKAKASYIKARAESLKNAEGWVHARPPTPDAFGTNGRTKGDMPVTSNPFPIWVSRIAFGLALIGIWLAIGIPAYRERNQSQAASQTLPAKQANPWEENYGGGQAPSPTPSAKQNQPPQASETGNQISFGENDKIVPPPNVTAKRPWSGKPFDKNDTTAEIERLAACRT